MPLLVIIKGNVYLNKPDLPKLGEALREMVGELKKPIIKDKYPLHRDSKGRFLKP